MANPSTATIPRTPPNNDAANNDASSGGEDGSVVDGELSAGDYKVITRVIFGKAKKAQIQAVKELFTGLGIAEMEDFLGQVGDEIMQMCVFPPNSPLAKPIYKLRLKQFFDYASISDFTLDGAMTTKRMVKELNDRKTAPNSLNGTAATGSGTAMLDNKFKMTIPSVDPFSGQSSDYFQWIGHVQDEFGKSTLTACLEDPSYHQSHPSISQSCFHALSSSLRDGLASHLATEMVANGNHSCHDLYKSLEATFNTDANKANFVVFAVKSLIDVRLDHNISVEHFLSDWNKILLRLQQNGSDLASNKQMLRAFLLHAIQSDEFREVQTYILSHPEEPMATYLQRIRATDSTANLINGVPPTAEDIGVPISRNRRAGSESKSVRFPKNPTSKFKLWNVPALPATWKTCFPSGLIRLVNNWRTAANGTSIAPEKLNAQFNTTKVLFEKRKQTKRKNRRTSGGGGGGGNSGQNDDGGHDDEGRFEKRARIMLASPRLRRGAHGEMVAAGSQIVSEFTVA